MTVDAQENKDYFIVFITLLLLLLFHNQVQTFSGTFAHTHAHTHTYTHARHHTTTTFRPTCFVTLTFLDGLVVLFPVEPLLLLWEVLHVVAQTINSTVLALPLHTFRPVVSRRLLAMAESLCRCFQHHPMFWFP